MTMPFEDPRGDASSPYDQAADVEPNEAEIVPAVTAEVQSPPDFEEPPLAIEGTFGPEATLVPEGEAPQTEELTQAPIDSTGWAPPLVQEPPAPSSEAATSSPEAAPSSPQATPVVPAAPLPITAPVTTTGPAKIGGGSAQPSPNRRQNLPNGRVGEPYAETIDIGGLIPVSVKLNVGAGIELAELRLQGVPTSPGDYSITIEALRSDGTPETITNYWTVVADPRSLWKDLPSDPAQPYQKPSTATKIHLTPAALVVGASKRGRSHAHAGTFRDDDFGFLVTEDGWYIAVVADGAGSAKYSRQGSKMAVDCVLRSLPPLLTEHFGEGTEPTLEEFTAGVESRESAVKRGLYLSLAQAALAAAQEQAGFAESEDVALRDLATTLIITVAKQFGENWFTGSFGIGDGGAAVFGSEGPWVYALTDPDSGEFAGQTRFLSMTELSEPEGIMARIRTWRGAAPTVLALMTDGVSDPMFQSEADWASPAAWQQFWSQELAANCDLTNARGDLADQLLAWLDFYVESHHDDRTILLILPQKG